MNYSVEKLSTVEECARLLQVANLDKNDLVAKKIAYEKRFSPVANGSGITNVDQEIVAAEQNVSFLTNLLPTLAAGDFKDSYENQLREAVTKLYKLRKRLQTFGVIEQLQTAYDFNAADKSIAESDVFIAAVMARQAELA